MEEEFKSLCSNFSTLRPGPSPPRKMFCIKTWLRALQEIDYRHPLANCENRALFLIHQMCKMNAVNDLEIIKSTASLIIKLVRLQHLKVEGHTLLGAINWCFMVLDESADNPMLLPEMGIVLMTLDALIRYNREADVVRLQIFAMMDQQPKVYSYCTLAEDPKCFGLRVPLVLALEAIITTNHAHKCDMSNEVHEQILNFFVSYLTRNLSTNGPDVANMYEPSDGFNLNYLESETHATALHYALSGIRYMIQTREDEPLNIHLKYNLLGVCNTYMVYNLKGVPFVPPRYLNLVELPLWPDSMSKFATNNNNRCRQRKRRHVSRMPGGSILRQDTDVIFEERVKSMKAVLKDKTPTTDSDSAINDSKVRLEALALLQTLFTHLDKNEICGHFLSFTESTLSGDGSSQNLPNGNNLLTCFLKDPHPSCRLAAHLCMQTLLMDAKMVLQFADQYSGKGSVTSRPGSKAVGVILLQLHHSLCLGMSETSHAVLTQLLKTTTLVVRSSSYLRLTPGLCAKVIRNVRGLVTHSDTSVQVGALTILGSLLTNEKSSEIQDALLRSHGKPDNPSPLLNLDELRAALLEDEELYAFFEGEGVEENEETETGEDGQIKTPWLLERCIYNIKSKHSVPAPVQIESLHIIGAMCERYFDTLICPYLSKVGESLVCILSDLNNLDINHHAVKAMVRWGEAVNANYQLTGCLDVSIPIWLEVLGQPLNTFVQFHMAMVRGGAADLIGAIGTHAFELIPSGVRLTCITVLLSLASDHDVNVRASAVRSVGILLLFTCIHWHSGYILDASDIIVRAMADDSLAVRARASWALGNLSDALVQERELAEPFFEVDVKELKPRLLSTIDVAISGTEDNDKVCCNAVRALGNFLTLFHDMIIESWHRDMLTRGITALLHCASNANLMKVRWNACYALGNVLTLPAVYSCSDKYNDWLASNIFIELGKIIAQCPNIKVCINATAAILSCSKREYFGDTFLTLWASLIKGLVGLQNVIDPNEFEHCDKLALQTCETLGHLAQMIRIEDLGALADTVADGADALLAMHVQKMYYLVLPEKHIALIKAYKHLKSLESRLCRNTSAERALRTLTGIFQQDEDDNS